MRREARVASVTAVGETKCRYLTKKAFDQFDDIRHFLILQKVPLLSKLTTDHQLSIVRKLRPANYEAGDVVVRQGDPGDHLYIVHSGAFAAFVADAASGQEAKVADYKSGQYFGELALLYNSPRAATVRAQETGTCYCLNRATFRTLVKGYLTK